ncbi:hypothetical protein [Phycobacter sp. K97]|uniref:hypothetical protein n=1 Tax=Phycobacter sedimenti TaxID=3133977 RepID=UPI00311D86BD
MVQYLRIFPNPAEIISPNCLIVCFAVFWRSGVRLRESACRPVQPVLARFETGIGPVFGNDPVFFPPAREVFIQYVQNFALIECDLGYFGAKVQKVV